MQTTSSNLFIYTLWLCKHGRNFSDISPSFMLGLLGHWADAEARNDNRNYPPVWLWVLNETMKQRSLAQCLTLSKCWVCVSLVSTQEIITRTSESSKWLSFNRCALENKAKWLMTVYSVHFFQLITPSSKESSGLGYMSCTVGNQSTIEP